MTGPVRTAGATTTLPTHSDSAEATKRFVEPYQYDDEQRAAIGTALAENGLGDTMAQEIFIGAIAYDLALLKTAESVQSQVESTLPRSTRASAAAPRNEPPAETPSTTPLADSARRLAACLGTLDEQQRATLRAALDGSDSFDRTHDDQYLNAVAREAGRIADAASAIDRKRLAVAELSVADTQSPSTANRDAESDNQPVQRSAWAAEPSAAIAFIKHAANVYEQCFDAPPSIKTSEPFARVLGVITAATGIPIPVQARVLKRALRGE
ncbi:MAG: hypothetical protein WBG92_03015 [Thiohalocapsa sp.]